MQRTRLSTLVELTGDRINRLFTNPWRRIALLLIGFLSGVFMGSVIITTAGQDASLDIYGAGLLLLFTEIVSNLFYSRIRREPLQETVARQQARQPQRQERSLLLDVLNVFKLGLTYSLFLEAFKLGS
jgi:Na+/melibiose symporter-like transporter